MDNWVEMVRGNTLDDQLPIVVVSIWIYVFVENNFYIQFTWYYQKVGRNWNLNGKPEPEPNFEYTQMGLSIQKGVSKKEFNGKKKKDINFKKGFEFE